MVTNPDVVGTPTMNATMNMEQQEAEKWHEAARWREWGVIWI
ncbi:MAG: hypothetical protein U9N01_02010 [Euryarchaeota archaeon]|nr:hypothetical protein [Euryarchaeota archaeon]